MNIKGEVYTVDQNMLEYLDILEAYPHLYSRKIIKVKIKEEIVNCWMYLIENFKEELLTETFIGEYSDKIVPWNDDYLSEKDGSFLFNLIKKG